jgi:hypothetical protein
MDQRSIGQYQRCGSQCVAPDEQGGHADQNGHTEYIGAQPVEIPYAPLTHKNKSGDVRFEHIPDIDQDIEHEPPRHKAVDHARQGSGPECRSQSRRLGY